MKSFNRYRLALGVMVSLALAFAPCAQAQTTPSPAPTQVGWSWPAQGVGSGSFGAFGITGLRYFSVDWVVSGSVVSCAVTLDGAVNLGGSFTTGSIIASQNCATSGNFTTSSATENVQAQLSYAITGTGTVTFIVRGYAQNPGTAGSSSSSIISPVDGSGYVEANCKTGCTPGNPNGQAVMANSAPVVIASNQSSLPVAATPTTSASALLAGQQAVTASAAALPSQALTRTACVLALPGNTLTVYVGPSGVTTSTGFPLAPGASLCNLPVANLNQIYLVASSTGSSVAWSAQ